MKAKNIVAIIALVVLLAGGVVGVVYAYNNIPITYDGSDTNVVELYNDPTNYDVSDPDGVADVMVKENLEKTMAANNVAAIVFDYRGFDTLGESFILLTAIAGAFVILSISKSGKNGKKGGSKK